MSSSDQTKLVNFLQNGGNLYLEGSDVATCLADTELLNLMGSAVENIGNTGDEISNIIGIDNTFAAGIFLEYDGGLDSHYKVDHLQPIDGESFFKCEEDIIRGISVNNGSYKTIMTSTIIGAFKNGEGLNLRDYVMGSYLNFFAGTEVANDEENNIESSLNIQNFPNPFILNNSERDLLTIEFTLKEISEVTIDVFNVKGQKVNRLCDEDFGVGVNSVHWNGKNSQNRKVNSGVYFYQIKNEKNIITKKILILN